MKSIKRMEVKEPEYEEIKSIQFDNKSMVMEHKFGTRTKLISDGMFIAYKSNPTILERGNITNAQFISFIGLFNKQLYHQFLTKPELFDLEVEFQGMSRQKNMKAWKSLKINDYFYNIDLNSAYWQIAHKLGYINDKMFKKYLEQDAYKQVKRYVISFLGRKNFMRYYQNPNEFYEIKCDEFFFKNIYTNVRFELYRQIANCVKSIDSWIEFNIDGVFVKANEVDNVQDYFRKNDLKFKLVECRKISESEYLYKGRPRIFKTIKIRMQ